MENIIVFEVCDVLKFPLNVIMDTCKFCRSKRLKFKLYFTISFYYIDRAIQYRIAQRCNANILNAISIFDVYLINMYSHYYIGTMNR